MKETIWKSFWSVIISSLIVFFFTFLGNYFSSPKGQIVVTDMNQQNRRSIIITKWTDDNVVLKCDIYGDQIEIIGSNINYYENSSIGAKKEIEIYNFPKNNVSLLTIQSQTSNVEVVFTNYKESKFIMGMRRPDNVSSTLRSVIPVIVVYVLFILLMQYLNYKYDQKTKNEYTAHLERVEKMKKESETKNVELAKNIEKTEKEVAELKIMLSKAKSSINKADAKYRLILNNKIRDMATELDFWYGTIREIMISTYGRDENTSRELQHIIKEKLNTRSSYTRLNSPEAIKFYEGELKGKNG